MELLPIVPHLFMVPGARDGQFPFSHSVLADSSPATLMDAGCGLGILTELMELSQIELVITSHSHPDHTAGCHVLEGLPIYAPEMGADTFGRKDLLAVRFTEPGPIAEIWKSFVTGAMGFEDVSHTHTYGDGHVFDLGQINFMAIHTPGHTKDHMCLFETIHGILLSFDMDLTPFGPFYGHRESDITQYRSSIQKIMDLEPRVVVSSHMGIIKEEIQARLERFLSIIDGRHGAIYELVRVRPRTLPELVFLMPIYHCRPCTPELLAYWEGQMIKKHLDLLLEEGRIRLREDGRYETRAA